MLDNCSAHPQYLDDLSETIQVHMLPPNTTALIQPIDQGIIYVLKSNVKKKFYKKFVDYCAKHPKNKDPFR